MKLSGFGLEDVQVNKKEPLSSGFLKLCRFTLRHALFKGGMSVPIIREAVVRPPSVGVILYDPDTHKVVLIEQFRIGPLLSDENPWMLEVVAGISEPGESLEDVALKEVAEETGCSLERLIPAMDFYMSPGATNEKFKLFCGIVDAEQAGGIHGLPEEGEDIRVHALPFEDACDMVEDGRIANAPAVVALQWLQLHHHELKL